jgi:hypothetical protein
LSNSNPISSKGFQKPLLRSQREFPKAAKSHMTGSPKAPTNSIFKTSYLICFPKSVHVVIRSFWNPLHDYTINFRKTLQKLERVFKVAVVKNIFLKSSGTTKSKNLKTISGPTENTINLIF